MMNPAFIYTAQEKAVLELLVSRPGKREMFIPPEDHPGYMRWSRVYRSLVERKVLVPDQEGCWGVSSIGKYWLRRQTEQEPV